MQVELAKGGGRRGSRGPSGPGGGYGGSLSRRSEYRVMVTGLPSHCSWQDLKDFMRKVGDVTFANVSFPRPCGPTLKHHRQCALHLCMEETQFRKQLQGTRAQVLQDGRHDCTRTAWRMTMRWRVRVTAARVYRCTGTGMA